MPRAAKGPRLYLRRGKIDARTRKELPARYYIRDGSKEIGTGCGPDRLREAEQALANHIASKWAPAAIELEQRSDPKRVLVADVLALYAIERAPKLASPRSTAGFIKHLLAWWDGRTLSEVRRSTCDAYVVHRTAQKNSRAKPHNARKISDQTARRELETLSAAIGYWHAEYILTQRPIVKLPEKPESPRDALTRREAARLLKAAMGYRVDESGRWERLGISHTNRAHLRRMILIGLYTGSRPGVTRMVVWEESATHPWVDLNAGVIYRRGRQVRESRTKRTPVVKLPRRLLAHMRRWRRMDTAREAERQERAPGFKLRSVIHFGGQPLAWTIRTGFEGCVRDAGLDPAVTPHWLRHTAATWLMESGVEIWTAAGFLGMTPATLEKHYGHHRPDYQADAVAGFSRRT